MDIQYNDSWDDIFESMYNGVVMINKEGIVERCNQSGCDLIGLPKNEIIGNPITSLVEGSELQLVAQDGIARPNLQQRIRDRIVYANRSPIWKDGQLVGAVSVFQDITELKEALNQLDEKEREVMRFKDILELLYDGIVMIDDQGIVTMINQTYCNFLEIKMEDAVGNHVSEVVENTRMHIVLKTGQAEIGSIQRVHNQNIVVMRMPIRKDGKVVGVIGKVMFTNLDELKTLAQRLNVIESKLDYYKNELKRVQGAKYSFDQIIGEHEKMKETKDLALKVAKSRSTVLIRGESGTGKEWFAHGIHGASNRSEGAFVRLNCAAIPADLMEAELFGYEEGAFTGAKKGGKPGKIELAQGGTLFLDEIGDMPLQMQVKLLRVLQEREVERIGGVKTSQVDIRIIAATNRMLEDMVKEGTFREDLYYRLNVFRIAIPPLRDRGSDIITTAQFILGRLNNDLGKSVSGFDSEVEHIFRRYAWPGNVREMQNVIERAIHMVDESKIRADHLPEYLTDRSEGTTITPELLKMELEKTEIRVIKLALKECKGNRIKAAKLLGIHRASLYRKLEKYNVIE